MILGEVLNIFRENLFPIFDAITILEYESSSLLEENFVVSFPSYINVIIINHGVKLRVV